MTIATDQIIDGDLITLPPEAGDVDKPRFQPNEAWLRTATPDEQKTAMWRWFATHYEDPETAVPHDEHGNYTYTDGGPFFADEVLHERFDACVPPETVDELARRIETEVGNEWALKTLDKFSG